LWGGSNTFRRFKKIFIAASVGNALLLKSRVYLLNFVRMNLGILCVKLFVPCGFVVFILICDLIIDRLCRCVDAAYRFPTRLISYREEAFEVQSKSKKGKERKRHFDENYADNDVSWHKFASKKIVNTVKLKRQNVTKGKVDDFLAMNVFDGESYGRKYLPKLLSDMTYEKLRSLLGSLVTFEKKYFANKEEAEMFKEIQRQINFVNVWLKDQIKAIRDGKEIDDVMSGRNFCCDLLVRLYGDYSEALEPVAERSTFDFHNYESHPRIVFPKFASKYFDYVDSKGKRIVPVFEHRCGEQTNVLFDLLRRMNVRSKQLPFKKIKSIFKDYVSRNMNTSDIIKLMRHKCFVPKVGTIISNLTDREVSDMSWVVPWLPPSIFFYEINDEVKAFTLFLEALLDVRRQILEYSEEYFEISKMSKSQIEDMRLERIKVFKNHMRSPGVQARFINEESVKQITDDVNRDVIRTFWHDFKNHNKVIELNLKGSKKQKSINIKRMRFEKYQQDFECQSNTVYFGVFFVYVLSMVLLINKFDKCRQFVNRCQLWLSRFNSVCKKVEVIEDKMKSHMSIFEDWRNIFKPEYKVILLEVKSVLHALYHAIKGNKVACMEWLSNFLISRSDSIMNMSFFNFEAVFEFFKKPTATVIIDGKEVCFDKEKYWEYRHWQSDVNRKSEDLERIVSSSNFQTQNNVIHNVLTSFTNLCSGNSFLNNMSESEIRQANAQFVYMNHVKRNTTETIETLVSICRMLVRTFIAYDPLDANFSEFGLKLYNIIKIIDALPAREEEYIVSKELMQKVIADYKVANEHLVDVRMQTMPMYLQKIYSVKMVKFEKIFKMCSSLIGSTHNRIEPFFILFTGPPNVGKTSTKNYFQSGLSLFYYKQVFSPEMVYVYNKDDDFWEKYAQQKFVDLDDMFVQMDVTKRAAEAAAVINMVNTSAYNLPQAFGTKGTVFFDSDFIFGSTNIANKGIGLTKFCVGLTDPEAMVRRFHLVLHREIPHEKEAHNNAFRVDKCTFDPSLEGHYYTAQDLLPIIIRLRKVQIEQNATYKYTESRLRELYPDFQVQNDTHEGLMQEVNARLFMIGWCIGQCFGCVTPEQECVIWIFVFILLALIYYSLSSFGTYLYNLLFPELVTQTFDKKFNVKHPRNKAMRVRKVKAKKLEDKSFETQADEGAFMNSAIKNVAKCQILIEGWAYRKSNDGEYNSYKCETTNAFHIKDGYVAMPAHFYFSITEGDHAEFELRWQTGSCEFSEFEDVLHVLDENDKPQDMVIGRIPRKINLPPALYKFLIDEKHTFAIEPGYPLKILHVDEELVPYVLIANKAIDTTVLSYHSVGTTFVIQSPINYYYDTIKGQSGSLIAIQGPQGQVQIIGMHVGKGPRFSSAMPITQEFFNMLLGFEVQSNVCEFPLRVDEIVSSDLAYHHPKRSKFKRSLLYGWSGAPTCVPTHLCDFVSESGEQISPLNKALAKFDQVEMPEVPFDRARLKAYLFKLYPKKESTRLFDYDQCLNGTGDGVVPSINFNTSPGYVVDEPRIAMQVKGKGYYLERVDDSFAYKPDFLEHLLQKEERLRSGQQIDVLWADILKDETLPVHKVMEGKARLFSSCDIYFLFLGRRYFLDFISYVQSFASVKPINVGINVHSNDWTYLFKRLDKFGGSVVAGDYSKFDGSVRAYIGRVILEYINEWYDDGECNALVRKLLFEHIFNARHICGDKIYTVKDSNPSGNFMTAIYNSLQNIAMTYIILSEDLLLRDDQFEMCVYGDDNVITIEKPGVTSSTLAPHYMRRFCISYTHWSKDIHEGMDTLSDIRYLGRSFVYEDSVYKAPLKLEVVIESTYWYKSKVPEDLVLLSCFDTFAQEMSHFSYEEFQRQVSRFRRAVSQRVPHLLDFFDERVHSYFYYHDAKYHPDKRVSFFEVQSKDIKLYEAYNADNIQNSITSRHEEFTDRATNVPGDSQHVRLGSYQDVAPIDTSAGGSVVFQEPHQNCNLEVYDLNGALSREYQMNIISWTTGQAVNTVIAQYHFPDDLFSQTFIAEKIKDFKFFRGGVRMSFRVTSNRFLYGKLLVLYEPCLNYYSGPAYVDSVPSQTDFVVAASGYPHVIMSAASGDAVVFDIPFISPFRALAIQKYGVGEMARVKVLVLNPLVNVQDAGGDSCQVFVTAQFLEPEVFLPHSYAPTTARITYANRILQTIEKQEEVVEQQFETQSKEATVKSEKGIVSNALIRTAQLSSTLRNIPFMSQYVDTYADIARGVAAVTRTLGLSKPTSVQVAQKTHLVAAAGYNCGKGVDNSEKLGMDPENSITVKPNVGGFNVDEMDLKYIMGTPMLLGDPLVVNIGDVGTEYALYNDEVFGPPLTYFDWVKANFKYHWGSVKIKIYVEASIFHSIRAVVYLDPDNGLSGNVWENCYHTVIDIQGSCEFEWTVPYCDQNVVRRYGDYQNTALVIKFLTWSQPDFALNTPIYINTYVAAASDFQVGAYRDNYFIPDFFPQSNPRADFSRSFKPFHDTMKGYETEKLVLGEKYETLREVLHRYQPYFNPIPVGALVGTFYGYNSAGGLPSPYKKFIGIEKWGQIYRFWRGSIRLKVHSKPDNTTNIGIVSMIDANSNPLMGGNFQNSTNRVTEVELPYYNDFLFQQTTNSQDGTIGGSNGITIPQAYQLYLGKAAGDDFSFHFLRPPRSGDFYAASRSGTGYVGTGWPGMSGWLGG